MDGVPATESQKSGDGVACATNRGLVLGESGRKGIEIGLQSLHLTIMDLQVG